MTTIGTLQTGKAEQSDLDLLSAKQKTDAATLAKETVDSSFNLRKSIPAAVDISDKADKSWVRDTLKSKQDALGYTPANKAGDTFTGDVSVNTKLTVGNIVSASGLQTQGNIAADSLPARIDAWVPIRNQGGRGGLPPPYTKPQLKAGVGRIRGGLSNCVSAGSSPGWCGIRPRLQPGPGQVHGHRLEEAGFPSKPIVERGLDQRVQGG